MTGKSANKICLGKIRIYVLLVLMLIQYIEVFCHWKCALLCVKLNVLSLYIYILYMKEKKSTTHKE